MVWSFDDGEVVNSISPASSHVPKGGGGSSITKSVLIFVADAPATRIAKDRRKFPAGILVPGMSG